AGSEQAVNRPVFRSQHRQESESAAIVRAVAAMGRSLNLSIIAEGVETEDQAACLLEMGCHYGQGYLFHSLFPEKEFAELLSKTASPGLKEGLRSTQVTWFFAASESRRVWAYNSFNHI
ncbi:MAG TPA: EAL domain-containing protein, partial [Burkholderiales bacterium]|nr:EAL domain-containing protein [Burkholderiales bacterium]